MLTPSVAIIGSGISGLAAAKEAVARGLTPKVFEKNPSLGGVWNVSTGKMWDTLKTNISRFTFTFSDYAWKNPSGPFPTHKEAYEYLQGYAEHFDLLRHIQFNSEVVKVKKVKEKWQVEWLENGKKHSALFDYVMVCSGVISKPRPFPKYHANTIHSQDYKNPEAYKGKIVTVIGNGCSGCEIAVDVAKVAKQVYNVVHKNVWILPRELFGKPLDRLFYTREGAAKAQTMSREEANEALHGFYRTHCLQEKASPDLTVDAPVTEAPHSSFSDGYVEAVQDLRIKIAKEVPEDSDAVIVCNGYDVEFPFFEQDILDAIGFQPQNQVPLLLHKTVFHPQLDNMAFIGCYRGTFPGPIELQARWATMVFSGKIPYPSQEEMAAGLAEEEKIRDLSLPFPHGDYVAFSDDLAKQIGALPDFEKMKEEDPDLYKLIWNEPLPPASYRLTGIGSDPSPAKELIQKLSQEFQRAE